MSNDPDHVFAGGDAPMLERATADSVIAQYIGGQLQTLTGHFQLLEPNQYAVLYQKWGGSTLPFTNVPGFINLIVWWNRNDSGMVIV